MSPASRREFILTMVTPMVRFFQITAGLTVVFGLLLFYNMMDDQSSTWTLSLRIGVVVAALAFIISEAGVGPAFMKVRSAAEKITPTSPPGPEFPMLVNRAALLGLTTTVLLIVTLCFMVTAGFY